MKSKVKWGVIGSGGIARRRTIPEGILVATNARLQAVYGTNSTTNQSVAAQYGVQAVDTLDALLDSDIDAVYIASPVYAHFEQTLACARAGKHVLCEKPLALSVAQAGKMARACSDAGVKFGTAFMMRFHTQHQAAATMIRQGLLGQPVYARAQLSCWYPPMPKSFRQDPALGGGGSLMDLANHCIDLLEMFFGPVKRLACMIGNTVHKYSSEDSSVVMLQFENGATGTVDTFFCIREGSSKNVLELYGSKGSILASDTIGQGSRGKMTAYLTEHEQTDSLETGEQQLGQIINPIPKNVYCAEIEEFGKAILKNRPSELTMGLGLRSQRIMAACYEAARSGKSIDVGA